MEGLSGKFEWKFEWKSGGNITDGTQTVYSRNGLCEMFIELSQLSAF